MRCCLGVLVLLAASACGEEQAALMGELSGANDAGAPSRFAVLPAPALLHPDQVSWRSGPVTFDRSGALVTNLAMLATGGERHVLVVLDHPLHAAERLELAHAGLHLLAPLGGYAHFAHLAGNADAAGLAAFRSLVAVSPIDPAWKMHPQVAAATPPQHAVVEMQGDVPVVATYVAFHQDVGVTARATGAVRKHAGRVVDTVESIDLLVVELPLPAVHALAREDVVQWVEWAAPRLDIISDSNRAITGVNIVQEAPYNLTGAGVDVLIYDGAQARATHQDFQGRLVVGQGDASGVHYHATHVACTVGGAGVANAAYKGMAPGVDLVSYGFEYDGTGVFLYDNPGDMETDYSAAINTYGADLSNNSIGTNTELYHSCSIQGDYGATAALIDAIARGSLGAPFRLVWANGNERQGSRCDVEGYGDYYSTAPPAGAKNHIAIGALNSNDDSMTYFSSWGPVDDGRLKPDVSAPGCQSNGDTGVTSCDSISDTAYRKACGTSMASPTVAGIAALMLQDFRALSPARPDPRNSTLKILLAHTAVDLGNPGPDYQFGYGSVRAQRAIDFMRTGNFRESELGQDGTFAFQVPVQAGDPELRVTLAWDDAPAALNVTNILVNDLDLRVLDPSSVQHYPWTLNPTSPSSPAVRTQADHINNIEQVYVANPTPGLWSVEIVGNNVPAAPQPFSVAASPSLVTCTPVPIANAGPDHYICIGSVVTLGTPEQPSNTYLWSPGGETTAQITVSPTETTTFTVTAATSACGSAQDAATVIVDDTSGPGVNEGFEAGATGWTSTGLWHLAQDGSCATPGYSSPTSAMYYGQDATCTYDTGAANSGDLISPDLYGISAGSTLRFKYFRAVQSAASALDRTEVAVSADGGATWTAVWTRDARNASENAWVDSGRIALGDHEGSVVKIRFRFESVDAAANGFVGWLIDDVAVTGMSACNPGNTAPAVEISAPTPGASFLQPLTISFAGSAYDLEDGDLGAAVSWTSSVEGGIGTGKSFLRTLSAGTHTITATSTDSQGLSGSASVTIEVVPDSEPPAVSLTAPAPGATLSGITTLTATASDNVSVTRVEFHVDSTLLASDTTSPYSASLDTRAYVNGGHTIVAKAYDSSGNLASAGADVTFDNDIVPPVVSITSPADQSTVSGTIAIAADASDDRSLSRVDFYLGTTLLASDTVAPFGTSYDTTLRDNGPLAIRAEARDAANNTASTAVNVSIANAGRAAYDATRKAPACLSVGSRCAALTLVNGRASLGPESNAPNTINNSCADGTSGTYHSRESLDKLTVETVDGSDFAAGKTARITATVWAYSTASDYLDLFYAANANAPSWTYLTTVKPTAYSAQTLTTTFTLGAGALQAIRGQFRYSGSTSACYGGSYNDRDDLIFAVVVDTVPPTTTLTAPAPGSMLTGPVALAATASDNNNALARVEFLSDGNPLGSDTTAPYSLSVDSRTLANGAHLLQSRAFDLDGNAGESAAVDVTVDNEFEPPVVSLSSPAPGAVVRGAITLAAQASDNRAVTKVDFLVNSTLIATLAAPPYETTWASTTVTNGAHTITARVSDASGNQAAASAAITVDNSVPTLQFMAPAAGAVLKGTVSVEVSATDNRGVTRVELYDNDVPLVTFSAAPYQFAWDTALVGDGSHTLFAIAFDEAGNNTSAMRAVTVDSAPPSVAVSSPAEGATLSGAATIAVAASDAASAVDLVEVYVDGVFLGSDSTAPYEVAWDTRATSNGSHVLSAQAYDRGGNLGVGTDVAVTVDNEYEPPVISVTAPTEGAIVRGLVTLLADATDNRAVAQVSFYVDTTQVGTSTTPPYSVTWDSASVANGAYTVSARAVDTSGNPGASELVSITVDNAVPVVSLSAPASGSYLRGVVSVEASASDNVGVARVEVYDGITLVGSDDTAPYSVAWDTAAATNGGHTLQAKAYDLAGNQGASATRSVTVDNTPPSVSLSAPAAGAVVRGSVAVSASASDNIGLAAVDFYFNATLIGTDTTSPYSVTWSTSALPDTSFTLTARARDRAGNDTTSAGRSVSVDNTGPAVSTTAPTNGALVGRSVLLKADASDPNGVYRVQFYDGATLLYSDYTAPYEYTWSTISTTAGAHSLTARATDVPGNTSTSMAVSVTVDNLNPAVSFITPPAGAVVGDVVSIEVSASDDTAVAKVDILDGAVALGSFAAPPYRVMWNTLAVSEGSHTLTARAYDTAGNNLAMTRSVTVDNVAPAVSLSAPADGALLGGAITVSATASDAAGLAEVEFYADGLSLGVDTASPFSVLWDTALWADGSHALTAVARDRAGHQTTSLARTVTLDNTLPAVAMTQPVQGALVGRTVLLEATATDASGVAKVEFFRDGAFIVSDSAAPFSYSWTALSLPSGSYTLSARAYDLAGNVADSAGVTVAMDTAMPSVTWVAPAEGSYVGGTVWLEAAASDNMGVARVQFYNSSTLLGSVTAAPYRLAWDTSAMSSANAYLTATAYDEAGNVASTGTVRVTIDNSGPYVNLLAPAANSYVTGVVTLRATAGDISGIASVEFYADGTLLGVDSTEPYEAAWDTMLWAEGPYPITLVARDNVGHESTYAATLVVDHTPPLMTITKPRDGSRVRGDVYVEWEASDNFALEPTSFFIDGQPITLYSAWPSKKYFLSQGYANGVHVLTGRATDRAGNSKEHSITLTFSN